jgi:predicted dehydrogenase
MELVNVEELTIEDDVEPLRAELEAFVASVTQGAPVAVSAEDGLAAVEVAARIVQAISPQTLS